MTSKTTAMAIEVSLTLTMSDKELDMFYEIGRGYTSAAKYFADVPNIKDKWTEEDIRTFFQSLSDAACKARKDAARSSLDRLKVRPADLGFKEMG